MNRHKIAPVFAPGSPCYNRGGPCEIVEKDARDSESPPTWRRSGPVLTGRTHQASITHKILLPSQIVATLFILSDSTSITRASKMAATQMFMPSQPFLCAAIARRVYLKDSMQNVVYNVDRGPSLVDLRDRSCLSQTETTAEASIAGKHLPGATLTTWLVDDCITALHCIAPHGLSLSTIHYFSSQHTTSAMKMTL